MSPEDGARNANALVEFATATLFETRAAYRGVLLDVRRVQPAFGPATRATLARFFAGAARLGLRVAVVVSDSAIQTLQFRRLTEEVPGAARLFAADTEAIAWLYPPLSARPKIE
jgi:hypothetical protein